MTLKDTLEIELEEDGPPDTNVVPETEGEPADSAAIPQPPTPAADRSPQPPIEPRT